MKPKGSIPTLPHVSIFTWENLPSTVVGVDPLGSWKFSTNHTFQCLPDHTLNWVFREGGANGHFQGGAGYFWGGAGYFFFFDEVKMKHFVFFREF